MDSFPKSVYVLEHKNYVSTFLQFENSTKATIHNSNISPQKKRALTVYRDNKILYFNEYKNPQLTSHEVAQDLTQKIKTIPLHSKKPCLEILVVDDGSTDGTREFLIGHPDLYTSLHLNKTNMGKGGAVQQGLRQAKGDYVLFQDADLEYDPKEYVKLFLPVLKHGADVVMGSRFLAPEWTKVFYFYHKIGNKLICLLFNLLFNTTWTDIYSC